MSSTDNIGVKHDEGKPLVYKAFLQQFPHAAEAIAKLAEKGSKKYSWNNWKKVSNGVEKYTEALVRHLLAEAKEEPIDTEMGELHAVAVAWNSLARLELILLSKEVESGRKTPTETRGDYNYLAPRRT